MAGTFQSLILTPLSIVTTPFPRRETRSLKIHPPRPRRSISTLIRSSKQSDEVDDSDSTNGLNWTKPLMNFAANNFLPLALTSGVAFGLANPTLGCLADKYYLSKFSTFGIFIVSGLTLCSDAIGAAVKVWPVGLFGLIKGMSGIKENQRLGWISFVGELKREGSPRETHYLHYPLKAAKVEKNCFNVELPQSSRNGLNSCTSVLLGVLHSVVYSILFKANTASSASTSGVSYRTCYI